MTAPPVARFEFHLESELLSLQDDLASGAYRPGAFFTFEVRDPKRRAICAAPYRDRVVHHALCAVLEPHFDRRAISDSYACRQGKGTHAAIRRARHFARRYDYFLKCDVRMDDFLLFADDKPTLHLLLADIRRFLAEHLCLALKEEATLLTPVTEGIPFLGVSIYPGLIRLNRRTRQRFRSKALALEHRHAKGLVDHATLSATAASLFAHVAHADSYRLRCRVAGVNIIDG